MCWCVCVCSQRRPEISFSPGSAGPLSAPVRQKNVKALTLSPPPPRSLQPVFLLRTTSNIQSYVSLPSPDFLYIRTHPGGEKTPFRALSPIVPSRHLGPPPAPLNAAAAQAPGLSSLHCFAPAPIVLPPSKKKEKVGRCRRRRRKNKKRGLREMCPLCSLARRGPPTAGCGNSAATSCVQVFSPFTP